MDLRDFGRRFPEKMKRIREYLDGDGVKMDISHIAIESVEENFRQEGYIDEVLDPWKQVKRRQPDSPWYGHSGETGRFSAERTQAKILHGEKRELSRATRVQLTPTGIRIVNAFRFDFVVRFVLRDILGRALPSGRRLLLITLEK